MSRTEKYLPFVLALLVPAWGMINSSTEMGERSLPQLVLRYSEAMVFVLGLWFLNRWLVLGKLPIAHLAGREVFSIVVNLTLISGVVFLERAVPNGLSETAPAWLMIARISAAALAFNLLQRAFRAQKVRTELTLQNLTLQAENLKFQVETLKQQINPHFLFNSLNTLLDLVEDDQEAAVRYLRSFSALYRSVLQSAKHNFVLLSDEINFLDNYWSLLKVRFRDAIELNIDIDEAANTSQLPPMSLQLLVENAVKHNEASEGAPLSITITGTRTGVTVSNNINPKAYPVESEGVGLSNLQERFRLLHQPIRYGREGDSFVVHLPLKTA